MFSSTNSRRVHSNGNGGASTAQIATITEAHRYLTARRMLLTAWFIMGVVPLALQMRSYMKFATPHKISESLLVPPDVEKQTTNLTELCPVQADFVAEVWWNLETTHYYPTEHGRICHYVTPQYNLHGTYFIGSSKVTPFHTTPSSCADDSFSYEVYFYHGSIGYYSFYEELRGTFCTKDRISYVVGHGLGTLDINGQYLADYRGGVRDYNWSYYYGIVGAMWLVYWSLVLRRSFISCERYGLRCEQMSEGLGRRQTVVFVQESLRLSAHGANNFHRAALLLLLVEGIMSDLFLLVANNGLATKVQYVSLGYNLSGLMLLIFEIIESMKRLPEKWRIFLKRLLFSYESTLMGEFVSAAGLQYVLTGLNQSDLRRSKPTALAVSYYVWSLVCHCVVVLVIIANIISVRVFLSTAFVWWKHRSLAIFTAPCCVDSTLGVRNRMTMLAEYRFENGTLYYSTRALKAFGLLRMEEEDGTEYLLLSKLHWLTNPSDSLFVIGTISGHCVEPCSECPATGVVSFFDRSLGGGFTRAESPVFFLHSETYPSLGRPRVSECSPSISAQVNWLHISNIADETNSHFIGGYLA